MGLPLAFERLMIILGSCSGRVIDNETYYFISSGNLINDVLDVIHRDTQEMSHLACLQVSLSDRVYTILILFIWS